MGAAAPDLRGLAAALRSCQPDDPEAVQRLGQQLQDAAAACSDGGHALQHAACDGPLPARSDFATPPCMLAAADDAAKAEALLTCITESFAAAGEQGKVRLPAGRVGCSGTARSHSHCNHTQELLDQLLLDMLPAVAPLAGRSDRCAQSLCTFCGLAAAAAAPRDVITALLEVLDQLTAGDEHR